MWPHGGLTMLSENATLTSSAAPVVPGASTVYTWAVTPASGPAEADVSSIFWTYHSSVAPFADVHAGLLGYVIVHSPNTTYIHPTTGKITPIGFDRELVLFVASVEEAQSTLAHVNYALLSSPPTPALIASQERRNNKQVLNGFLYGNSKYKHETDLVCKIDTWTRWYVLSFGNTGEHSIHWHAQVTIPTPPLTLTHTHTHTNTQLIRPINLPTPKY
jgi:hypothetical protein